MIESITTPGMGVNCYLLTCGQTKKAILIDPGAGSKMIQNWLKEKDQEIIYILLTHGHYDHIGSVEYLRNELQVQVAIHKDDAEMLTNPAKNLSSFLGKDVKLSPAEILLDDNQELKVGEITLKVIHTPGHTPGGICILTDDGLISGDTLFNGSVGRTDFPGGDMQKLISSIQNRLMDLPDETVVYPGHESRTTIGRERSSNPFINGTI
ncbi:MAG: MBL fold metallo-hydrolase [Gracilibacter sp. BRH_c7a]|nr:MAG: MBL fold metallo-hydrolase [Gracilibacter sp. BRH_c7a]